MLKKYPSPVKSKEFKKYWDKYLPIIAMKKGFDKSVLKNIEILCRLYILFDDLTEYLDNNPLIEENETRYGKQLKPNPALNLNLSEYILFLLRHKEQKCSRNWCIVRKDSSHLEPQYLFQIRYRTWR